MSTTRVFVPGRRPTRRSFLRRGAAVVELALVSPIFFVLIFGTIEYGRYVMVQQMLVNAAREGARVRVISGSTDASATTAVNSYLTGCNISTTYVTVTTTQLAGSATDTPYKVTVSVPFNRVSWVSTPWFLTGVTMSATSTMRQETSS